MANRKLKSLRSKAQSPQEKPNPKGGAPLGNYNALKHGFYSRRFQDQEMHDITVDPDISLRSEAQLLRVVMRRAIDACKDSQDPKDFISLLRAVTDGSYGISRLLKAELLFGEHPLDKLDDLLQEGLRYARQDLNLPDDLGKFETLDAVIGADGEKLEWLDPKQAPELSIALNMAFANWLWEQEPDRVAELRRVRHRARQAVEHQNKVFTVEGLHG